MQTFAWLTATLLAVSVLTESYQFANLAIKLATSLSAEPTSPPRRRTILVKCYEDSLEVVVQADLFDIGVPVDGRDLQLGVGSVAECDAVPSGDAEFTIHAGLTDCGTQLSSMKGMLVYSNVLVYSPEPSPEGLLRLDGATIPIKCQYQKRYGVDSAPLLPTWVPFTATVSVEEQLDFTLRIMTDDGLFERGSNVYFLGDGIHLEAAVITHHHVPLRVFVDHCVATVTPDMASSPKYHFIEHYGCLIDARLTGSASHFLLRSQDDTLHFVLDAFKFHQVAADRLYISCFLKALPAMLPVSSRNRACSFIDNSWRSADDNDGACGSCEVSRRMEDPTEHPQTLSHYPTVTNRRSSTTTRTNWAMREPASPSQVSLNQWRPSAEQGRNTWPRLSNAGVSKRGVDWSSRTVQLQPLIVLPEVVNQASVTTTTLPVTTAPQEKAGTVSTGPLLAAAGMSEVLNATQAGTPGLVNETRNPGLVNETRTPGLVNETRTPGLVYETRTPGLVYETRTPGLVYETRTPGLGNETRTPGLGNETRTPDMVNETRSAVNTKEVLPNAAIFSEAQEILKMEPEP